MSGSPTTVILTSSSTFADVTAMKLALLVTETSMVIVSDSDSVACKLLDVNSASPPESSSMTVMRWVLPPKLHPSGSVPLTVRSMVSLVSNTMSEIRVTTMLAVVLSAGMTICGLKV